jgi:hypothetical protein
MFYSKFLRNFYDPPRTHFHKDSNIIKFNINNNPIYGFFNEYSIHSLSILFKHACTLNTPKTILTSNTKQCANKNKQRRTTHYTTRKQPNREMNIG